MKEDLVPSEEGWQKAQQRVSLYLRLMNLPPLESLELALQALKQAQQAPGEAPPLSKSMRALRQILRERESGGKEDPGKRDLLEIVRNPFPAPLEHGFCGGIHSRPLLKRGFMLPEEVR